eukprot:525084_1
MPALSITNQIMHMMLLYTIFVTGESPVIGDAITCGASIEGDLYFDPWASTIYYYYYHTQENMSIIFDACDSEFDTYLYFYDSNFTILHQTDDDVNSDTREQLFISSLKSGTYILGITGFPSNLYQSGFAKWKIDVICVNNVKYILTDAETKNWHDIALQCEEYYGTTTATVNTPTDIAEALNVVQKMNNDGSQKLYRIWIGGYKADNHSAFKWMDGSPWIHNMSIQCNDDIKIFLYSYLVDKSRDTNQRGTYLRIVANDSMSTVCSASLKTSFFSTGSVMNGINQYFQPAALCNAPNSIYPMTQCINTTNCWIALNCCNDFYLINDAAYHEHGRYFEPPIAYWDSKLYVIGKNEIHYTNINVFDNKFVWNHLPLKHAIYGYMTSQKYAQYKASLFILCDNASWPDSTTRQLIHINLNTHEQHSYNMPHEYSYFSPFLFPESPFCMVVDGNNVYIFRPQKVIVYNISGDKWSTSEFPNVMPASCAITNDYKFIYIFGDLNTPGYSSSGYGDQNGIIRYHVKLNRFDKYVNIPTRCDSIARGISAGNGKIYLHGCHVSSWKTIIFDTKTETFEEETIDIDTPTHENIYYYRKSRLTMVEDNVLLLLHTTDYNDRPLYYSQPQSNSVLLYYAITNMISINLTDTIPTQDIWPSEGFEIKYNLNDFSTSLNGIYYVWFTCNDTNNGINTLIEFNVTEDSCICHGYKCYACHHYFDVANYLLLEDNNVDELNFYPIPDCTYYDFHLLIRPQYIPIKLQRCVIEFDYINTTYTTSDDASILVTFKLSPNCFSRIGTHFSLNITALVVNISKVLVINIVDNHTSSCHICDDMYSTFSDCFYCDDSKDKFVLQYETYNMDDTLFELDFRSNMKDFRVISSNNTILYSNQGRFKTRTKLNNNLLYLLLLLLIPGIIILVVVIYCRRQYMNAFIVDNALVLIIGVSQFDNKAKFLKGVPQNVNQLISLWKDKYKYDVFVCDDTLYCTKLQIIDFVDNYKTKLKQLEYKAIIIHIISHAWDEYFMSSDWKKVPIDFIVHEITDTAKEENNLDLIKVIFHHGCRGASDYSQPKNKMGYDS